MAQWLRLHAPNAGGWGQSLVRETDPMCCTAQPKKIPHLEVRAGNGAPQDVAGTIVLPLGTFFFIFQFIIFHCYLESMAEQVVFVILVYSILLKVTFGGKTS